MIHKLKEVIRRRYNISFSKAGDDIQLMKLINNNTPGTYVDIGSWDPMNASNTYFFYLRNWKGICIDPNPALKLLYEKYRPTDIFINAGIGMSTDPLSYYTFEESSINTFSLDFIKKNNLESKIISTLSIPVLSLKDVLDQHISDNERLDFFDVDVEGFDLEVLQTNDWNKYRPKVIVVESDLDLRADIDSEIVQYLSSQDYRIAGKSIINGNLGNLFLVSK